MIPRCLPRTVFLSAITSSLLIAVAPSIAQEGSSSVFQSSRSGAADGAPVRAPLPTAAPRGSIGHFMPPLATAMVVVTIRYNQDAIHIKYGKTSGSAVRIGISPSI